MVITQFTRLVLVQILIYSNVLGILMNVFLRIFVNGIK